MRTRGDFAVVALALLTTGNTLATYWAGALPVGVVLTACAAVAIGLALRAAPGAPGPRVIASGVAACTLSLIDHPLPAWLAVAVMIVATLGLLSNRWRLGVVLVVVAAGVLVFAEARTLQWGQLAFDVFREMQLATGALIHGVNPYGPTVPVLIPISDHTAHITPEHFGYGPGILLTSAPGRLLGDVRLSVAAIWVAIAVVLAFAARRQTIGVAVGVLALVLLSPFGVSLAEHAFNDANGALCLLLWYLGKDRHPRWARVALGVALTTKPTILAALLLALVWSRSARRDTPWALGIAAVIMIPFALWDGISNFLNATVGLWLSPVFSVNRADAITVGALAHTYSLPFLPGAVIGVVTILAAALIVRYRPRDQADLLLGGSVLTIAYLILGRFAFMNYYSVAAVLLIAAIAMAGSCTTVTDDDIALPVLQRRAVWHEPAQESARVTAGLRTQRFRRQSRARYAHLVI